MVDRPDDLAGGWDDEWRPGDPRRPGRSFDPWSRGVARRIRRMPWAWVWIMIGAMVAALVLGWWLAPAGRPPGSADLVPAESGADAGVPVAGLEPGECLAEYSSAWAPAFAVAPCAEPHAAEQYAVVPVASQFDVAAGPDGDWPGEEALRERAMLACQDPAVLDLDAAAAVADLRIEVRWPATQAEWDAGVRDYRCFAVAPGLTGSLAR
ncbi:MAG: hypothetical protein GXX90_04655 [Microbacteriaceae bacterium]|nr:hypothetical protein [Microbacteriaceae bacterium]